MKNIFSLFVLLCAVITISAQHRAFVWNHDRSVYVSSSQPDSITFTSPKINISLSTGDPAEITENSMTAYFVLKSNYSFVGKDVELGVCYSSIDEQPTIDNNTIVHDSEVKSQTWEQVIGKLDKGRTYYYRSYAKIGDDVAYGPTKSFATGAAADQPSASSYVDLGLSVKWASCNLGATKPEEYGDYFACGETAPKNSYTWENYKYGDGKKWIGDGSNYYTKYNNEDKLRTLVPDDDAATVNLGYPWHIPTKKEFDELKNKCTWKWETLNGKNGYRVIGLNGNTIFLPSPGRNGDLTYEKENYGLYWSSSWDDYNSPYLILFNSSYHEWRSGVPSEGLSVRPVHP